MSFNGELTRREGSALSGSDLPAGAAEPFPETPASGTVCGHCGRVHPGGRFIPGCPGPRLTTGEHSRLVRSGAATGQADAVARARQELLTELGEVGIVMGEVAAAFTELSAVRGYLGGRLEREGPLTGKGRTRALLTAYLAVVDRQVRLAQLLGIERKSSVPTARDIIREYDDRQQEPQP